MARAFALVVLLLLTLGAAPLRAFVERPAPLRSCVPEGRGEIPRHWLGCAADQGPPRRLAADEQLLLGLPIDANQATARELAFVPGLSRTLAARIVRDREENGPFPAVEALERVRGIGPKRLARARPSLTVAP